MADPNTALLLRIAEALGDLRDRVVFIGGCATALLITDEASAALRVTDDVDVIAGTRSLGEYHRLGEELRKRGFSQALADGHPPYRWTVAGIKFDVMPISRSVLGFSNRWYETAMDTATPVLVGDQVSIRLITAPCLVATKLEAFWDRGRGDYLASHDLEDVIAVVEGRPELVDEMARSDSEMKIYIAGKIARLLRDGGFLNALPGLVMDSGTAARTAVVLKRLQALARMK